MGAKRRLREAVAATELPQLERGQHETEELRERDFSTTERIELAKVGKAIPVRDIHGEIVGGRYPIETAEDVRNAVHDADRTGADTDVKRHIDKLAREVDAVNEIPEPWHRELAGLKPRSPVKRAAAKKPKAAMRKTRSARESARPFVARLHEAAVEKKGNAYEVTLLREGAGNASDKNYYTPEALRKAVSDGLFEGAQCYADHPTATEERERPERSVRSLIGHFREARFIPGRPAEVRAKFIPVDGAGFEWVTSLIESALKSPADRPLVGLSIEGYGHAPDQKEIDGKVYNLVRSIESLGSVDLVTRAGAGGKFHRRLSESLAGARASVADPPALTGRKLQKRLREALARLQDGLAAEDDEQVGAAFVALHEAASAELAQTRVDAGRDAEKLDRLRGKLKKAKRARRRAEARADLADRARIASKMLREAGVSGRVAELWLEELVEQPSKETMRAVLDRRQAQRRDELAELRESAGLDLGVEGAGRREPVHPAEPPSHGGDLLWRMGIDRDELEG